MREQFETERLILRAWTEEDAEELYRYANDDRVGPIAGWPVHTSEEDSRGIIKTVLTAEGTYAVVLKETGLPVGSVGLMAGSASNLKIPDTEAEIGYWIGVPFWGKGLIPEAVGELMKYAFEELDMDRLWCGYFDGNEKSRRVQEKCGFLYERTDEAVPWPLMGDIRTEHVTCITRQRWKEKDAHFAAYELSPDILEALKALGYDRPTAIQQKVIPAMLAGKNVMAKAPTGSGKTAAFAVPVCESVQWEENAPQALILEPTRELTVQVRDEVFHIGRKKRLKVPAVFGGVPIDKQILTLRQKSHVAVGTPGRVMDHLRRGSLKLDRVSWLILDEADLMLDMGFIDEVREICTRIPKNCRIALFSATLKPELRQLADEFMGADRNESDGLSVGDERETGRGTVELDIPQERPGAIVQKLFETESEAKYETFLDILIEENPKSCIIFCGTREMVNVLFQKLRRSRIFCGMLHGEMDQKERLKTVDAFRRGGFRFLIATDVAARGIDFDQITHVVNYDFPTGKETYVHRIGRTGRNGKDGIAVSLVTRDDLRMVRQVEEYIGHELAVLPCPVREEAAEKIFWKSQRSKAEQKPKKGAELNAGIMRLSIGGGRKSKMRAGDIVGTVCGIEGVDGDDIGIIDIRDSLSYVEIRNNKGGQVLEALQTRPIKGKIRKVRQSKGAL